MKYFRTFFVSLFFFIRGFCSWDQQKFNELKQQLGGEGPFCVICVARSGNTPLSSFDVGFIQGVVSYFCEEIKYPLYGEFTDKAYQKLDPTNICKRSKNPLLAYQQPEFTILNDAIEKFVCQKKQEYNGVFSQLSDQDFFRFRNTPGIIVFNEYFFGNKPIPQKLATELTLEISQKCSHKLVVCNFLTQSEKDQNIEKDQMNFELYRQKLTPEPQEKCVTNIPSEITTDKNFHPQCKIENQTFFGFQNQLISSYKKSSYVRECDDFIKTGLAYYSLGDFSSAYRQHFLSSSLRNNFSLQICLDYIFGRYTPNSNFQIIQSFPTNPPIRTRPWQQDVNNPRLNNSKYLIFCDPKITAMDVYDDVVPLYEHNVELNQWIQKKSDLVFKFQLNDEEYIVTLNAIE